jgi:hypothetical protein
VASNNGGHKTIRIAKKKGGSSEFIALLPGSFSKQSNKIPAVLATFSIFEGDFLNAIRTVLARRHRSHYSSGFKT